MPVEPPADPSPMDLGPYPTTDLGDGLVLRSAATVDAERLALFNGAVFGESNGGWDEMAAIWTRDLLRGDHPTSPVSDHTLVEERATGEIVSSCLLISQLWSYGGTPFGVGRPELISTRADYRGRGLIGAQLARIHARSDERGHHFQAITGIPNYYRRFGYEPALVTSPGRSGGADAIPALPDDVREPFRFRPADENDLVLIVECYRRASRRSLISAHRDERLWRYELLARSPGTDYLHKIRVIERPDGAPAGLLTYVAELRDDEAWIILCEALDGGEWNAMVPAALRFVRAEAGETLAQRGRRLAAVGFEWTADHPVHLLARGLLPRELRAFAWHVRLTDPARFLRLISPALLDRLAASPLAGFRGELTISFYRDGLRLVFQDSGLTIESLPALPWREANVGMPAPIFSYLIFGARSFRDLEHAHRDCWVRNDTARSLVEMLFPVRSSAIWPIG